MSLPHHQSYNEENHDQICTPVVVATIGAVVGANGHGLSYNQLLKKMKMKGFLCWDTIHKHIKDMTVQKICNRYVFI